MLDTSNRKHIRILEKAAAQWDKDKANVLRDIMSSAYGRRWIWDRLASAGIFAVNPEPTMMAFREGMRSQGCELLAEIMEACPEQFIQAMRENNERRTQLERAADAVSEHAGGEESGREPEVSESAANTDE